MKNPKIDQQRSFLLLKLNYLFHDMPRESDNDDSDKVSNMNIEELNEEANYKLKMEELEKIFKKIKLTFDILGNLLKYIITRVDNEKYKNVQADKVEFPKTMETLICIIGCYSEAFTQDTEMALFEIVDLPFFADLYNISEIHAQMIPFVIDEKINSNDLARDYNDLANNVRNLASDVLDLNIEFEEKYIEYSNEKSDGCGTSGYKTENNEDDVDMPDLTDAAELTNLESSSNPEDVMNSKAASNSEQSVHL